MRRNVNNDVSKDSPIKREALKGERAGGVQREREREREKLLSLCASLFPFPQVALDRQAIYVSIQQCDFVLC